MTPSTPVTPANANGRRGRYALRMSNRRRASSTYATCARISIGAGIALLAAAGSLSSVAGAAEHAHGAVHRSAAAPSATARTHPRQATAIVPSGTAPPGGTVFGTTPADTPESVSFILRARDLPQLKSAVEQGVHNFLSVSQFAQTYGQSPAHVDGLEAYLAGFGIQSQADADDLDVTATGTAGQFDQALAVQQLEYHVPAHPGRGGAAGVPSQTVHGSPKAPKLPTLLAREVLTVLGLTNYGPFTSQAVRAGLAVAPNGSIGADQCVQLSGVPDACNLPTDFDADYGLDPLIDGGSIGAGQTIGIVTEAALDPGAPQYFWSNVLGLPPTGRTVTVENVDGGPGAPSDFSGSNETDLDVEQSGGVAPGANVIVYQSPNSANGFADAFFDAASQNVAGSVSASWGVSETALQLGAALGLEPSTYAAAFDEAFLEMAEQGQSTFAAAGDAGAYGASRDIGSTNLSVIDPGDSAFITSAGGTTLPWSGSLTGITGSVTVSVPSQRAWGWDYLWPAIAKLNGVPRRLAAESEVIGGGGGFSADEPLPIYQQGVAGTKFFRSVRYLTPTKDMDVDGITVPTAWRFDARPAVTNGTGSGRAVPDLSADADPLTGYLVYDPSALVLGEPALQGGWGGTSFVAPQLNGSSAVIESYLGHRVGFWNPSIYALASSAHSPFTPLQQSGTMNDNLFYTGEPGSLYNEATGLGVPDLSELASDLKR
jgi:kumamolisin